jgi:ribosomal protein L6P/L9E
MSRVGKMPIELPAGVEITISADKVVVQRITRHIELAAHRSGRHQK